ncbi:MAG: hypothetical protein J6L69_10080 [Lachnospiraceae bacterium]|nr:hypothetical protein [Lachnospiraceae bacterium]
MENLICLGGKDINLKDVSHTDIVVAFKSKIVKCIETVTFGCKRSFEVTLMKFPGKTQNYRESQSYEMNYELFINTMAEMLTKYADELND